MKSFRRPVIFLKIFLANCELVKESEKKMSSSKLSKLSFPLVPLLARDEKTTLNWEENDAGF